MTTNGDLCGAACGSSATGMGYGQLTEDSSRPPWLRWLAAVAALAVMVVAASALTPTQVRAQCPGLRCGDSLPPTVSITPGTGGPHVTSATVTIQYCDSKPITNSSQVVTFAGVAQSGFTATNGGTCTNPNFPNGVVGSGTIIPVTFGNDTLKAKITGTDGKTGTGVVVWAVADDSLSPRTATVNFPASVTGIDTVTLKNIGSASNTYTVTATCHGSLSSCSVASPQTLASGASTKLVVSFTTSSLGTSGTVIVRASNTSNASTDSAIVTVNAQSWMAITQPVDPNTTDAAACATYCFAVSAAQATIPYVSGDQPRNVTLHYNGDAAMVRPILMADAALQTAAVPTNLQLQAKTPSGALITFANGEDTLVFSGPSQWGAGRLAGAFDAVGASIGTTGSYKINLIVTAAYGAPYNFVDIQTIPTRVLVVNDRESPIARGWTLAGVQHVYWQSSDSGVVLTEGDGSAKFFSGPCVTSCSYQTPHGDFTTLRVAGTGGSTVYTRKYVDSTTVLFNNLGQETSVTDRLGRQVSYTYDGSGRVTRVTDPWRTSSGSPTYTGLAYGATWGLASITEPGTTGVPAAGRVTTVSVRTDSTLGSVTDPDSRGTSYLKDASRRVIGVVNRRGDTAQFAYDTTSGKLTETTSLHVPIDVGGGTTHDSSIVVSYVPWQIAAIPTGTTHGTPAAALECAARSTYREPS